MGIEGILTLCLTPVALYVMFLIAQSEPASQRCNMCQAFVGYDFCTLCEGEGECDHKATNYFFIVPVPITAVRCTDCRGKITGRKVFSVLGRIKWFSWPRRGIATSSLTDKKRKTTYF